MLAFFGLNNSLLIIYAKFLTFNKIYNLYLQSTFKLLGTRKYIIYSM